MNFVEKIELLLWNSLLFDRSILYGKDLQHGTKILIMLALCSMLSGTYYAQNYAGIMGGSLFYLH